MNVYAYISFSIFKLRKKCMNKKMDHNLLNIYKHKCLLHLPPYTGIAAAAKSLWSCLTLCDPIDGSPPGPAVPGILQARTLEWVAISSSNA